MTGPRPREIHCRNEATYIYVYVTYLSYPCQLAPQEASASANALITADPQTPVAPAPSPLRSFRRQLLPKRLHQRCSGGRPPLPGRAAAGGRAVSLPLCGSVSLPLCLV